MAHCFHWSAQYWPCIKLLSCWLPLNHFFSHCSAYDWPHINLHCHVVDHQLFFLHCLVSDRPPISLTPSIHIVMLPAIDFSSHYSVLDPSSWLVSVDIFIHPSTMAQLV
ncbi:hypothetical protein BS17DRAFT_269948 [Gyrodon lividus]|nr:hypothetical protein BS17DRAFT_269948 [Gyrodon lividus]